MYLLLVPVDDEVGITRILPFQDVHPHEKLIVLWRFLTYMDTHVNRPAIERETVNGLFVISL